MKYCIDCKHYNWDLFKKHCCGYGSIDTRISLITGKKVAVNYMDCGYVREGYREVANSGRCGEDAKFFEPKESI